MFQVTVTWDPTTDACTLVGVGGDPAHRGSGARFALLVAVAEGWSVGADALPMTTAVALEELGTKGETSLVITSSMSKVAAESTEIFEVKVPLVPSVTGRVTEASPQLGPTLKDL